MAAVRGGSAAAALLIDADNISDSVVIERALTWLRAKELRLTVRRAYGGHEKLAGMKDWFMRHGVRALVNQGKGTTDVLLVVDVMDLFYAGDLPDVVAIASSDADFAPLAVRLRESGRTVICFAQWGKAAREELAKVYEEVIYLDEESAAPPPARRAVPASRAAPASRPAPVPRPEPEREREREPAPRPARKATAKKAAPKADEPADTLRQVLGTVPGFNAGSAVEMNEVVKRLRDAELLSKSGSGPRFLAKNAPYVELTPASQPNKVRLKPAGR